MHSHDNEYKRLLGQILAHGVVKGDRTGTGTQSLFGAQVRFDLEQGFPLLTTKKLPMRWIAEELFWFLSGSTDEGDLQARGVDIWKEWATEEQCARFQRLEGDLGPVYGWQWRSFGSSYDDRGMSEPGVDQIAKALTALEKSPDSRRIIVTGWNPKDADTVALPPCHTLFQFGTHQEADGYRRLSCHMYQRSADVFLGVPFNIASYALLVHMFAHVLGYGVGDLIVSFGDVHIYSNHQEQVAEQLSRSSRQSPGLEFKSRDSGKGSLVERLMAINYDSFELTGYKPHPKILAPVAV